MTGMGVSRSKIRQILEKHHGAIIDEWVRRLHAEVSPRYSAKPLAELYGTISKAAAGNLALLGRGDFSEIDRVIEEVGRLRAEAGFPLSEVQKAFELYRPIVIPIFRQELSAREVFDVLDGLNGCLAYTIHRFSDYFQGLHEQEIREYARILEVKVEERTRELAESEGKYRLLVEEIRDGYFVNQGGRIVFANKAFCDMHGYLMREVIGRPYTDFVAPESLGEVRKIYERRVSARLSKEQYVYNRLHKNGMSFPTENRVTLSRYGGKAAAIGICRDITERTEMERRVRESERLAHIGELTMSLAHEIRNPLSAAQMSIQTLLQTLEVSGNNKRRLEILAKEVSRLDRIVTEMLDFAKPVRFEFGPASIRSLVDSCLDALEGKIREKAVVTRRKFPVNLPALSMDREKMEQAVINVILNALEAVPRDGEITIWAKRKGRAVRIEIGDNGPGVRPEDLPYIFDPFFSRKARGTGLGLANAKKIVEAHGGTIGAVPGRQPGTTIFIELPLSGKAVPGRDG